MGIDDEPAAAIGCEDQRFPALLEPGKTLKNHPLEISAIERNVGEPASPQHYHDPRQCFSVVDSFGRFHPIPVNDILWHLGILKTYQIPKDHRLLRYKLFQWRFFKISKKTA